MRLPNAGAKNSSEKSSTKTDLKNSQRINNDNITYNWCS